ncbi:hypothetical protein Dtox_4205 [Desulfofarcimen acetoxidans DSM 771]|uniref:Uncharacterized protein n=1 Tax=Desulfofarcimen acetoxidans (strain ATCC 49208 / DSM 771 / KCTC 5769 / VKM B-1644 / 5575) TaxID=485916 RepID=C8VZC7_DESAS|nr:hypothetical protein Dtox_4205 [Desulfofarcimen acetoxidans DSM 771]
MKTPMTYIEIEGYCPHLKRKHSITVGCNVLHLPGRLTPKYSSVTFKCDYIDECRHNCPLEKVADNKFKF